MNLRGDVPSVESHVSSSVWLPKNQVDRELVQDELKRILCSIPFRTSKRSAALLAFVVEKTIEGEADTLKERTIGVEVFHRNPSYDTSTDPVVRGAATDVRKRLAQYYYEPGRSHELHIELPAGSYVPEFRLPSGAANTLPEEALEATAAPPLAESKSQTAASSRLTVWARSARFSASFVFLLLGFAAGAALAHFNPLASRSAISRFWRPLEGSPASVLLCAGAIYSTHVALRPNAQRNPFAPPFTMQDTSGQSAGGMVYTFQDSLVLAKIAAFLQTVDKSYAIRGEDATAFSDLRSGPAVLVGAYNNDWTMRLTEPLRFHFKADPVTKDMWIEDRQRPNQRFGEMSFATNFAAMKSDYAIVLHALDPSTEQMVVAVAGITPAGTVAAGEFVTNPQYLEDFAKNAPSGWDRKNFEILIETNLIETNSGPPHVAASYFW
jgi:hypothetical protein